MNSNCCSQVIQRTNFKNDSSVLFSTTIWDNQVCLVTHREVTETGGRVINNMTNSQLSCGAINYNCINKKRNILFTNCVFNSKFQIDPRN